MPFRSLELISFFHHTLSFTHSIQSVCDIHHRDSSVIHIHCSGVSRTASCSDRSFISFHTILGSLFNLHR